MRVSAVFEPKKSSLLSYEQSVNMSVLIEQKVQYCLQQLLIIMHGNS